MFRFFLSKKVLGLICVCVYVHLYFVTGVQTTYGTPDPESAPYRFLTSKGGQVAQSGVVEYKYIEGVMDRYLIHPNPSNSKRDEDIRNLYEEMNRVYQNYNPNHGRQSGKSEGVKNFYVGRYIPTVVLLHPDLSSVAVRTLKYKAPALNVPDSYSIREDGQSILKQMEYEWIIKNFRGGRYTTFPNKFGAIIQNEKDG